METSRKNYRLIVGKNVAKLRMEQGMSLRRFALMVGMDYTYLCEIERGAANATIDILDKIALGLSVDLPELFM